MATAGHGMGVACLLMAVGKEPAAYYECGCDRSVDRKRYGGYRGAAARATRQRSLRAGLQRSAPCRVNHSVLAQVDRANDSTKFLSFAKLTEQYYELMKHEATILPAG